MEGKQESMDINLELKALFDADQKDREDKLYETDYESWYKRDGARLIRAKEIAAIRDTLDISIESLFHLGLLFQHGSESADYKLAFELASEAAERGYKDAEFLTAAAEDRYLLSVGQKQKWGSQILKKEGVWRVAGLVPDEISGITDEMRIERRIRTRAEQIERAEELNRKDVK